MTVALWVLPGCAEPASPRNLVVITLDTVRRDHLPTYGYPRDTAPKLDRFAREAVVFDDAISQETNTTPSHASMFTGVYPHVHGSRDNGQPVPPPRPTLAEILKDAGFRTGGFVSATALKARGSGLERGFDVYDDAFAGPTRDGGDTARRAVTWLEAPEGAQERTFLFLHLYDAHGPYLPPPGYRSLFTSPRRGPEIERIPPYQVIADAQGRPLRHLNDYVDLYDGEIRYLDDLVAGVLSRVDPDTTAVVILSDHGETLGERYHPLDHGGNVFDEQIRIPLLVRAPGLSPRRVGGEVETVDLLPTVLELLEVALPRGLEIQGKSLLPRMRTAAEPPPSPFAFATSRASTVRFADRGYRLDPSRRIQAVRSSQWKLIRYPVTAGDVLELYDLAADPGELRSLTRERPAVGEDLRRRLDQWQAAGHPAPSSPEIDPEVEEQLRSLGYVQ
jgi:choline-sulfatase